MLFRNWVVWWEWCAPLNSRRLETQLYLRWAVYTSQSRCSAVIWCFHSQFNSSSDNNGWIRMFNSNCRRRRMQSFSPHSEGWTHLRLQYGWLRHQGSSFSGFSSNWTSGFTFSLSFLFHFLQSSIFLILFYICPYAESRSRVTSWFFFSSWYFVCTLPLYSLLQLTAHIYLCSLFLSYLYRVNDLKVFTEHELMDMALKQVLEVCSSRQFCI